MHELDLAISFVYFILNQIESFNWIKVIEVKTWLMYYAGEGGVRRPPFSSLHMLKLRFHTKKQFPRLPGSALKVCVEILWQLY